MNEFTEKISQYESTIHQYEERFSHMKKKLELWPFVKFLQLLKYFVN